MSKKREETGNLEKELKELTHTMNMQWSAMTLLERRDFHRRKNALIAEIEKKK